MRVIPRLHKSTYVVLLLTAVVLVFAMVPGSDWPLPTPAECRRIGITSALIHRGDLLYHGWPWVYLASHSYDFDDPRSAWSLQAPVLWFDIASLGADLFVALIVLVTVAAAFEAWRRRHTRLLRLSLRELMVAVLVIACGAWWCGQQRARLEQQARLESHSGAFVFKGSALPVWCRWFDASEWPILERPSEVHLTGNHDGISACLKTLHAVPDACVLRIAPHLNAAQSTALDLSDVQQLVDLRELEVVAPVEDWTLEGNLSRLHDLTNLTLMAKELHPQLIASLAPLENIQKLTLVGANVRNDELQSLRCLPNLTWLALHDTAVNDERVSWLSSATHLEVLHLWNTAIGDRGMAEIGKLRVLTSLSLRGTKITDAGLAHLDPLRALLDLTLAHTSISDAGLAHCAELEALVVLDLDSTHITDAGLVHLGRLKELTFLTLDETQIAGPGLVHLGTLSSLRDLRLNHTRTTDGRAIDDDGVKQLAALVGLNFLGLAGSNITGQGLRALATLDDLSSLDLSDCMLLDDVGLQELRHFKGLRAVRLKHCRISDGAKERLQQSSPELSLER